VNIKLANAMQRLSNPISHHSHCQCHSKTYICHRKYRIIAAIKQRQKTTIAHCRLAVKFKAETQNFPIELHYMHVAVVFVVAAAFAMYIKSVIV